MEIYASARAFMREAGNATQWSSGYPTREIVERDVESEHGFVVEENGEIIGAFFFKIGIDSTYIKIYDGKWINEEQYGTIHRIAVKYRGRGVVDFVYNYCFGIINNLKIDTHKDNLPMQKSLAKNGFKYCGVIYLESGDERIAYQKAE
jgi:RimJ/RimL family protein N-acetyltransferase